MSATSFEHANSPTAFFVAHPGHELRVFGWVESIRPMAMVLTDGSGSSNRPRIANTARSLSRLGCEFGGLFGQYSDNAIYQVLLNGDIDFVEALIDRVVQELTKFEIQSIVGDSAEGYNPSHDLCRLVIEAAVARMPGTIANLAFPVTKQPSDVLTYGTQPQIRVSLDEKALLRKQDAAYSNEALSQEVEKVVATYGWSAFSEEWFAPQNSGIWTQFLETPPYYESYGQMQLELGKCTRVIRYREHLLPFVEALLPNALLSESIQTAR